MAVEELNGYYMTVVIQNNREQRSVLQFFPIIPVKGIQDETPGHPWIQTCTLLCGHVVYSIVYLFDQWSRALIHLGIPEAGSGTISVGCDTQNIQPLCV